MGSVSYYCIALLLLLTEYHSNFQLGCTEPLGCFNILGYKLFGAEIPSV